MQNSSWTEALLTLHILFPSTHPLLQRNALYAVPALAPWFPTFGLNLGSLFWLESTPPPPAQWIWSWFQCCLLHQGLTDTLAKRLWTLSQLPPNPMCHFLHVSCGVPRVKFPQAPGWAETQAQACRLLGPTSDTTWSFFLKVGHVLACFIIRPSLRYCM